MSDETYYYQLGLFFLEMHCIDNSSLSGEMKEKKTKNQIRNVDEHLKTGDDRYNECRHTPSE